MIEEKLAALTTAIEANTAALREILDAGSVPETKVVHTIAPAKKQAKVKPEPVIETPVPENPVTEETPETQAPAPAEPEAPDIVLPSSPEESADPETLIASIIETYKSKVMGAPDAERKVFLKTQLPVLRAKWGLGPDDKLAVLTPTPEKLVGLLADIEAL